MATHDFNESIRYERSKFNKNNLFYTDILNAGIITRVGFDNEESRALQRLDVDVCFFYNEKKIYVSEKDRQFDYNDLLIEFYSKYPDTLGWMNNSAADYLAYFVPGKVYWIDKKQLFQYYNQYLSKVINDSVFAKMIKDHPRESRKEHKQFMINSRNTDVTIVQAYNAPNNSDATWYTESICIKFDVLRAAGVSIVEYKI